MPPDAVPSGFDVVGALTTRGGFRLARRERGLAVLVRGYDVVVVPETERLTRERLLAILARAGIEEAQLLAWLGARAPDEAPKRSGFYRRFARSERGERAMRSLEELVEQAKSVRERAAAAHESAQAALVASTRVLETLPPPALPSSERLQAVCESLDRWREALRAVEAEEDRQRRQRR